MNHRTSHEGNHWMNICNSLPFQVQIHHGHHRQITPRNTKISITQSLQLYRDKIRCGSKWKSSLTHTLHNVQHLCLNVWYYLLKPIKFQQIISWTIEKSSLKCSEIDHWLLINYLQHSEPIKFKMATTTLVKMIQSKSL